jgi:cell division protein FtsB
MLRLKQFFYRHWPSLILGVALVALVLNGVFGPQGPRDLLLLRQRRAQFEARRAALAESNARLETIVQNLRSNNRYLERLIRSELGWVRPDEIVYKFAAIPGPRPSGAGAARRPRGR